MKKYNLGIIGCGNMSRAIIRALKSQTAEYFFKRNGFKLSVTVSDTDLTKLDEVRQFGVQTVSDNSLLVSDSQYVLLAIKPQCAEEAMNGLDFADKTVISIMAGVSLERLRGLTAGRTDKIVRVMPNLNAKVGQSVNSYCCCGLSEEEEEFLLNILGSFGRYFKINESKFNSVTGISGSGPAFAFMFINAFIQKGVSCGFDYETAKDLALETIGGCVENVRKEQGDLVELIDSVCSKGGTTIEGVNHLRKNDFENLVKEAITKSEKRSEEMEKGV